MGSQDSSRLSRTELMSGPAWAQFEVHNFLPLQMGEDAEQAFG